jgi:N-acetylglutamate synthase-like GNAT family acetyltransferase
MSAPVWRPATSADAPAVLALLRAQGLPTEGVESHLPHFLIALDGSELLACAGLEPYGEVALLRSVAVSSAQQCRGWGRQAVAQLQAQARRGGAHQLYLLTTTAERYFEALGFERIDRAVAPAALAASAELRGACPASATLMRKELTA